MKGLPRNPQDGYRILSLYEVKDWFRNSRRGSIKKICFCSTPISQIYGPINSITEERRPLDMAEEDRQRWNTRYREGVVHFAKVDSAIISVLTQIEVPGLAADIACGSGRHALWLANNGWRVDALDVSDAALEQLQNHVLREHIVGIEPLQIDLDQWHPETSRYDLTLMAYFWDEEVCARALNALKPGGHLILRTFVLLNNLLGPKSHYVNLHSQLVTQLQSRWRIWLWDIEESTGIITVAAQKP
jgi:SAM-dependent methyltransferase